MRLNPVMQSIIHQDQTGFIHVQQLSKNLRILFNILYSQGSLQLPEVLFSLDVQKAFDHIEYEYCFKALRNCGFGSSFCTWISILYTHPADCIRTYRVISDYFGLYRVQDRAAPRKQTTNNIYQVGRQCGGIFEVRETFLGEFEDLSFCILRTD